MTFSFLTIKYIENWRRTIRFFIDLILEFRKDTVYYTFDSGQWRLFNEGIWDFEYKQVYLCSKISKH